MTEKHLNNFGNYTKDLTVDNTKKIICLKLVIIFSALDETLLTYFRNRFLFDKKKSMPKSK